MPAFIASLRTVLPWRPTLYQSTQSSHSLSFHLLQPQRRRFSFLKWPSDPTCRQSDYVHSLFEADCCFKRLKWWIDFRCWRTEIGPAWWERLRLSGSSFVGYIQCCLTSNLIKIFIHSHQTNILIRDRCELQGQLTILEQEMYRWKMDWWMILNVRKILNVIIFCSVESWYRWTDFVV